MICHSYFRIAPPAVTEGPDLRARQMVAIRKAILDTGWMRYSGDLNVSFADERGSGLLDVAISHSIDDAAAVRDVMVRFYQ